MATLSGLMAPDVLMGTWQCIQAELAQKKAASQPASRAVWCFGIKYEDPKYFYIMGMAGAGALARQQGPCAVPTQARLSSCCTASTAQDSHSVPLCPQPRSLHCCRHKAL